MNAVAQHLALSAALPPFDHPGAYEAVVVPVDESADYDHDMLDVEEGGAPLYEIDMEESIGQPSSLSPQDASTGSNAPVTPNDNNDSLQAEAVDVPSPAESFDEDNPDMQAFGPHTLFLTNLSPGGLAPDNLNSVDFLRFWLYLKRRGHLNSIEGTPRDLFTLTDEIPPRVVYEDLKGDEYDIQGINWQHLGVTRRMARRCRFATFRNYTNKAGSDVWDASMPYRQLSRDESYFRFRSMDLRRDVCLLHFQLRNILGCASRTRIFYPGLGATVQELDPTTGHVKTAMSFREEAGDMPISTLTAEEGVLMTGSFNGSYRYRSLETEDPASYSGGRLTKHPGGITNHAQIFTPRYSSGPIAAFSSNDYWFRMVDLTTNQSISEKMYDHAVNCSRLSPDKRLRVMVGDELDVMIADAETGAILQRLEGHKDFGFACDWAPDGWTIATGNQDKTVRIWDARKWKNSNGDSLSVAVWSEMSGVRSLRFSPLGSGKRVLLAAEEADIVNIINAQTFSAKQTVDVFGELAGVSFAGDGQEVFALSSDPIRGGIMCLERCDDGIEDTYDYTRRQYSQERRSSGYDWLPTPQQVVKRTETQVTLTQKQRQAAMAEDWCF
jgi:WD40 repeat protein